jgi:hypothetical protein
MATELKPPEPFTRGELALFMQLVDELLASSKTQPRQAVLKVRAGLWRVATGETRRKAA